MNHRRRTAKPRLIVRLFNKQGGKCAYCGEDMLLHPNDSNHPHAATKDHIFPRSKGGVSDEWNEAAAHRLCNCKKGSTHPIDYLAKITHGRPWDHPMWTHPAIVKIKIFSPEYLQAANK